MDAGYKSGLQIAPSRHNFVIKVEKMGQKIGITIAKKRATVTYFVEM